MEEELGHLHVLRMRWLALPSVHIPVAVGSSGGHVCGAQGKDSPSGVGPYLVSGLPGGDSPFPWVGWGEGPQAAGQPVVGKGQQLTVLLSGERREETRARQARVGFDHLLGLEMKNCWWGPGVSLGPQLSHCCWKPLERGLEGLSPLAGTATLPPSPGPQGARGLCQRV